MSIAIAFRAAQRSTIQEDQLNYGFKKRPIDQLPKPKKYPNIPEEKLFDINSKVIEFRKPTYPEEDEFKIEESDEEMNTQSQSQSKTADQEEPCNGFSYSDIGFSELTGGDRKFVNVPISTTPNPFNVPLIESERTGRIINLPEESKTYLEQLLAEYMSQQCEPKDVMTR